MTVRTTGYFTGQLQPVPAIAAHTTNRSFFKDLVETFDLVARQTVINVKDTPYNVLGDGSDEAAKIQAAHDALPASGGTLLFPPNTNYSYGPLNLTKPCTLFFAPGATVTPIFDTNTTQRLHSVSGNGSIVDGLQVSNLAGIVGANKYLVYVTGGAQGCKVRNSNIQNITMSDGNVGLTNLLVVHCFYADAGSDLTIEKNIVNITSGAAVFCRNINGLKIEDNHFTDSRWYTITLDSGCTDFTISNNTIDGNNVLNRYWGGSINLMSQIGGTKNKRGRVIGNWITGKHNYGACIRVLSAEDVTIRENHIYGASSGTINIGTLQYIGVDRRGTAEGQPENGPNINLTIEDNHLIATTPGPLEAIYIKNQFIATRSPSQNIVVRNNQIISTDNVNYFEGGVWISGSKAGMERVLIADNNVVCLTVAGSPQGGAIGAVSTNATGQLKDVTIINNTVRDVGTVTPSSSVQVGIFAQTFIDGLRVEGNRVENFFHGIRTLAGLTNVVGLDKNTFINCINDTLFGTLSGGQNLDLSFGTAIPIVGTFRTGHQRINQSAAASASPGWQCTTTGGAHSGLWTAGSTYATPLWIRNAANRVYELITPGGGVTSVAPSGVVVGIDETGVDGYTWRCRALAPVRWGPMAALGVAVGNP